MGRDANDLLQESGPDAIDELLAKARPHKGKAKGGGKANGKPNGHAHDPLDEAIDKALDAIDAWLKKPSFWEGEAQEPEIAWLVCDLVPASGAGLLSGQWGMFKTFVIIDLAVALSMGTTFAGRVVMKKGGILIFAAEGAATLPRRLKGLREAGRLTGGPAPIVWRPDCPTLIAPGAADIIVAIVEKERAEMKVRTGQDLVVIAIDTVAATAGWKDEDASAEAQKVMGVLQEVHKRTGCVVIGVDHFGKAVETGTRGSSAKEAAADFVLALLGTRDLSGKVTDCKLAVRKMREGESGIEIPFEAKLLEMTDAYGNVRTTRVIEWQTEPVASGVPKPQWTRPTLVLRQALEVALNEQGKLLRPFGTEGPEVMAVDKEIVRKEFYVTVNVESEPQKASEAKKKAFKRAVDGAHTAGLIGLREIGGAIMMWTANGRRPTPEQATAYAGDFNEG